MRLCFSFFLVLALKISAEIVEIKYISEIAPYVKSHTLFLFNLDNTLMQASQEVGSEEWLHHRRQVYEKKGLSSQDAKERSLAEWTGVQWLMDVKWVESHAAALIKDLQDKGHVLFGITSRGFALALRVQQQLKSLGIHLERTAPTKEEIFFPNSEGSLFRQGVLFTAGSHRGQTLKKLFKEIRFKPKSIVAVDDKISQLKMIEEYCLEEKIPFVGLRYGYLDEKVKSFQKDVADLQFEKLKID